MADKAKSAWSFTRIYTLSALVVLNTIVALAFTNWGILAAYKIKRRIFPSTGFRPELSDKFTSDGAPVLNGKRSEGYQAALFDRLAFGDFATDQQIGEMLDEFSDFALLPRSYLGFGLVDPPSFQGKHLRLLTDEVGVRYRWTPSAEPRHGDSKDDTVTIYIFGGSTTFGLHVADQHTWPSYLERDLSEVFNGKQVVVRNYGRPGFDSLSELALFLLLLQRGQRPNIAIFLDGVNEHRTIKGDQFGNKELAKLVNEAYRPRGPKLVDFPAVKNSGFSLLAESLGRKVNRQVASSETSGNLPSPWTEADLESAPREMAESYLTSARNIKAIARANGVRTFFFLQPDSTYNYPKHLFRKYPSFFSDRVSTIKGKFYEILRKTSDSSYLGDLFQKWGDRKAIVDDCHYNPAFSEFLARTIASMVGDGIKRSKDH